MCVSEWDGEVEGALTGLGVEVVACLRVSRCRCSLTSSEVREEVRAARRGFVYRQTASLGNHLTFSLYIVSSFLK